MSDSDEGAFASADEGDSPTKSSAAKGGQKDEKKNVKKEANAQKKGGGSPVKGKSHVALTQSDAGKKEPEKQQKQSQSQSRQKKKGKDSSQNPQSKTKKPSSDPDQSSSSTQVTIDDNVQTDQPSPVKTDKGNKKVDENKTDLTQEESKSEKEIESVRPKLEEPKEEKVGGREDDPSMDVQGDDSFVKKPSPAATPEKASQGGGWGWGGWGSSLLSVASTSVQTFTHQIGDGFTTIMDTVESSLDDLVTDEKDKPKNAPETDCTLANSIKEEDGALPKDTKEKDKEDIQKKDKIDEANPKAKAESETPKLEESNPSGGNFFASWGIADIAKKMTDTGKSLATKGQTLMTDGFDAVENLASGGIDVLESLGKKTYHTFSEHDPAFKKTREYLKTRGTKPNLSSVLRDAKDQAEQEAAQAEENEEARKVHFETQLDEYQGIAHLEALEMLSGQSEKKVLSLLNSLSSDDHKSMKPILISIKEVFEVEEEIATDDNKDQDFSCLVNKYLSELKLGTSSDKLNRVHEMVKQWMADLELQDSYNPKAIHQQAIQSLAELTSKGVEQFHKAGELVLMQRDSDKDCKERAHSFARLTGVLCHEVGNLANKFTDCLNKSVSAEKEEESDVTALGTNIYLEASNSTTYIQDAFQLLLPILQQATIEHMILSRQS